MSEYLGDPDGVTTLRVTFNAEIRTLPRVARTLTALDELWAVAYEVAAIERSLEQPAPLYYREGPYWYGAEFGGFANLSLDAVPRPHSVKISLASPLVVELSGVPSWPVVLGTTAAVLRYLIKNADSVGAFIPRIAESWYRTRLEAHDARERWRHRRGLTLSDEVDQLSILGQRAGQVIAEAEPGEPEISGPGEEWTPPWSREDRRY